jgi:hypothetical protein
MATELDEIRAELRRVSREVEMLRKKLNRLARDDKESVSLADLRGVWKGANFTEEEIEAAKIRVKEVD